jgi:beta-lactam-binding protein with PASTA domain
LNRTDAEKLLRDKGLTVGQVTPDIQGTVIDQNPHEGTQVVRATPVDLRVK